MALQVWLPLTKDLRQQGLNSSTISGTNVIINNNGKLGGCYSFNGSSSYLLSNKSPFSNSTDDWSYACWFKPNNQHQGCLFSDRTGVGLTGMTIFYYESQLLFDDGDRWQFTPSKAITVGVWNHLVFTRQKGVGKKLYLNGELINSINNTNNQTTVSSSNYMIGASQNTSTSASGNFLNGYLNDVRIYDHCLSPMEVKQLSQGLVLHYPLNRQGWGQENLMRNTYRADGNNSNQVYGWMANGNGNPEIVIKDGSECIHLQASCSGAYTPSIVSASKLILEYGVEYVISCDLMYDKEIKVNYSTPIHYHSGSSDTTNEFNMTNVNNGHGFNLNSISPAVNTIIPPNTWQHYEQHITAKSSATDSSLPYLTYRAFIYGSNRTTSETATVNMWLKNWKIEKGPTATPWCPNSADALATTMGLNSTTEYDCSGFNNNGERKGATFNWDSNTSKYSVSQVFNGSDNAIQTPNLTTMVTDKNYTIACWTYKTVIGTKNYQTIYGGPSGFELEARNTSNTSPAFRIHNWGGGTVAYEFNKWYHFCFVHTESDSKLYINGELKLTGSSANVPSGNYFIGAWSNAASQNYEGLMSDFRIYATALSADDVLSLYQNSAYIDNSGNVYGTIHEV